MKKINKKGFTLVELMAVLVVLIVIIFIAIRKINKSVDNSQNKSIVANAGVYIKAVSGFMNTESLNNPAYLSGEYDISALDELGITVSGTKPDGGYVVVSNADVAMACLIYNDKYVLYSSGTITDPKDGDCSSSSASKEFSYTGKEEVFNVAFSGYYKLEVWGAQGGTVNYSNGTSTGGYGGYSVGDVYLNAGDKLYVNVGGSGSQNSVANGSVQSGGYNGGGVNQRDSWGLGATGGGATHIAKKTGLLSTLSGNVSSILIVAGGGGAGGIENNNNRRSFGGNAGGFKGNSGSTPSCSDGPGAGGTQTEGSGFGTGNTSGGGWYGSAGGGFYGGKFGCGGGGGSGYIGNTLLDEKAMYCYNCATSSEIATKTISNVCAEEDPTENCSKKGNGFARVTFDLSRGGNSSNNTSSEDEYKFSYTGTPQSFVVPETGSYMIEVWGAQGQDNGNSATGGKGAYAKGEIDLQKGEVLYVYVGGGQGSTYNGGANGVQSAYKNSGGATDVRLVNGDWNNAASLASRIIVAAGGGGAASIVSGGAGGTLTGIDGGYIVHDYHAGHGGTQTAGGAGGTGGHTNGAAGSFGKGAAGTNYSSAGGGGYYGGGSSGVDNSSNGSGGGGSSYISGHTGCVAIKSASDLTPKDGCTNGTTDRSCSIHYSGKVFTDTEMISGDKSMPSKVGAGKMVGNKDNGYAKITYLD